MFHLGLRIRFLCIVKGYQQTCSVTSECYTAGLLQCSGGICDCPLPQSSRM